MKPYCLYPPANFLFLYQPVNILAFQKLSHLEFYTFWIELNSIQYKGKIKLRFLNDEHFMITCTS